MANQQIGILHPGAMGTFIARCAQTSGNPVYWASDSRSPQTRARAEKHNLRETKSLAELVATCSIILSVCPPDAAEEVANQVCAHAFKGLYLDANAIAPQRAIRIGAMMTQCGARFVDGGIIGGTNWDARVTWLVLSGQNADEIAALFADSPLQTRVIGDAIGKASALKMCYAAYTKGTTALLSAILATAQSLGVRAELETQWSNDDANFANATRERVRRSTAKAWRFVGEMNEIAGTFRDAGLPGEFHDAAAEIYKRMARFKDAAPIPSLDDVLDALTKPGSEK
ncbi:MAG: NAD(P)-dependent oxidoreductase [Chloroflexi bacterium]|nr:NAD(P)-dependent oxidoreductase [Chloroflexota bacterium]